MSENIPTVQAFTFTMDLLLICYVAIALAIPLWIFTTSKSKRMVQLIDQLPGPLKIPVLGNAWMALNLKRRDFFDVMTFTTRRYWPLFRTWNGPVPEIHMCDPKHAEVIFNSSVNIGKSYLYEFLHPWLGTGLLTSKDGKWHSRRKMITPTFHFKILENFFSVFVENSARLAEKLRNEIGNEKGFDVYPYITHSALDIICETAMGVEINALNDSESPYVKAIYEISELVLKRILSPWVYNDFIYSLTNDGKAFKKKLDVLHGFTNKVIRDRKRERERKPRREERAEEEEVFGRKKKRAFLDLLLEISEGDTPLSDEDIREEVDTFMFEGHDTTTASICWTLLLLGNHPNEQERVFEELNEIFQGSDRAPTMSDIAEMKYLERVIKESLRLYPSVPFIGRRLTQEVKIEHYTLPVGVEINIHICHMHRNEKYFPDPDKFNPDNFLPEVVQKRHPFAYVPFSAGSRNCIGQKFAILEEKTVLSTILRKYRIRALEKPEDVTIMGEVILRPADGVKLTIEER